MQTYPSPFAQHFELRLALYFEHHASDNPVGAKFGEALLCHREGPTLRFGNVYASPLDQINQVDKVAGGTHRRADEVERAVERAEIGP
jgi:hypothetical protein